MTPWSIYSTNTANIASAKLCRSADDDRLRKRHRRRPTTPPLVDPFYESVVERTSIGSAGQELEVQGSPFCRRPAAVPRTQAVYGQHGPLRSSMPRLLEGLPDDSRGPCRL